MNRYLKRHIDANEARNPELRIVSWGKYVNKKMGEVPQEYLEWFSKNAYHQMKNRKRWVQEELARRAKLND